MNHMVEEINQVTNQRAETVLEELCLVTFLVYCFDVVHRMDGLSDIPVREEVAGGRRGSNLNLGLSGNVVQTRSMGEHGDRVEVSCRRRTPGEDGTPKLFGGMDKEG